MSAYRSGNDRNDSTCGRIPQYHDKVELGLPDFGVEAYGGHLLSRDFASVLSTLWPDKVGVFARSETVVRP